MPCSPAELQQLDAQERQGVLQGCGLSADQVDDVETMLSGVGGCVCVCGGGEAGEMRGGRGWFACLLAAHHLAHLCAFTAMHPPPHCTAAPPRPAPPPAAMPTVWVSAQCVVEREDNDDEVVLAGDIVTCRVQVRGRGRRRL